MRKKQHSHDSYLYFRCPIGMAMRVENLAREELTSTSTILRQAVALLLDSKVRAKGTAGDQ